MSDEFEPLTRKNSSPFIRKPLPQNILSKQQQQSSSYKTFDNNGTSPETASLERHLTLFDMICIGIGATIGSGLFALCGLVAHQYAGPSSSLSWALAGLSACLSGCCYAEMAARVPASGSAYVYTFIAMGELPAVIAGACQSVQYIMAPAAVSRSWGDKMVLYLTQEVFSGNSSHWISAILEPKLFTVSPLAFFISTGSTLLLLAGITESKSVTNVVTGAKVVVVLFMVTTGFVFFKPQNWTPFIPPEYGILGTLRGSTATFFGYLGYDELCCLAGEVKNPKRNLPLAIMGTLVSVTILYIVAALSLTGMQPYLDISTVSGFPAALHSNGAYWASQFTSLGEVLTLPVVIPLTVMGQPRLQYALAEDGLIPKWFGKLNERGNLYNGTLFAGGCMILVATLVPFERTNDMISASVLLALSMTCTSLIFLWHESPKEKPLLTESLMGTYNLTCFVFCIVLSHFWMTAWSRPVLIVLGIVLVGSVFAIYKWCPRNEVFGGNANRPKGGVRTSPSGYFETPLLPFWPCLGILINWYLISQLDLAGIGGMMVFLMVATIFYFQYGAKHSVGNNGGWVTDSANTSDGEGETAAVVGAIVDDDERNFVPVKRTSSLPLC